MKMYQSLGHNSLEPITSIITIMREIVLIFIYQLAQLKQVIELSATEGYGSRRSVITLNRKHERVVKHIFIKLYTLPKACF